MHPSPTWQTLLHKSNQMGDGVGHAQTVSALMDSESLHHVVAFISKSEDMHMTVVAQINVFDWG